MYFLILFGLPFICIYVFVTIHPDSVKSSERESLSTTVMPWGQTKVFPKEHVGSPFNDDRVRNPTTKEFLMDEEEGSMLEEVSLLPIEELTSLMCGRTVYSYIKETLLGYDLMEFCKRFQEEHRKFRLRDLSKRDHIYKRTARLLNHEGCNEEFLSPGAVYTYLTEMLYEVIDVLSWHPSLIREFCCRLTQRLVQAKAGEPLLDSSFSNYRLYELTDLSEMRPEYLEDTGLSAEEVVQLMECLLSNMLRFFVLFCVHALRDQVLASVSNTGEMLYQLKYPPQEASIEENSHRKREKSHKRKEKSPKRKDKSRSGCQSEKDKISDERKTLRDDDIPIVRDLIFQNIDFRLQLQGQITRLPVSQIVWLVLGESLFHTIANSFPTFFAHLKEYAALLKTSQSLTISRDFFHHYCDKFGCGFVRPSVMEEYLHDILDPLLDWAQFSKKQQLVKTLMHRIKTLKPKHLDQPLWKKEYYRCTPPWWYYPLKTFGCQEDPLICLPKDLLERLSQRFDHFFTSYAIHVFSTTLEICEKNGRLRFRRIPGAAILCEREDEPEEETRNEKEQSEEETSDEREHSEEEEEVESVPAAQIPNTSVDNEKRKEKPVEETGNEQEQSEEQKEPEQASQILNTSVDNESMHPMDSEEFDEEGKWELKYYERVKEDSTLPAYFRTTFGVLVANNRDLREERAFLHSRLGLT